MIIDLRKGKRVYLSFIYILIFGAVFLLGINLSASPLAKSQDWPDGGEDWVKPIVAEGHLLDIGGDVLYSAGIDTVYQWHTFLGSPTGSDSGKALVLNEAGEIFVVGNSSVAWEGPGNIPPLNDYSGSDDIVVVKLDKNGFYQWHTFYGSLEGDLGEAVALDQAGNIYVAGKSRFTWDGPLGQAPLNSHEGCNNDDLVVIKLNSDGDYQWHTFFGSAYQDLANAIVLDPTGNLYITGRSDSPWDGPGGEDPLNAHSGGDWDLCVLKLSSAGDYLWHSFYGSSERDEGYALALGSAGDIYLTGRSDASWDGPDGESPVNGHTGSDRDLMLIKIDSAGTYHWHAFYGSMEADLGHSIAVGSDDHIYLAGESNASWDGPGGENPLNAHNNGARDVVIIKLDSAGIYHWHTFYGSEQRDLGYAIALDKAGNIYVTGYSEDYWAGSGGEEPLDPFIDNDANIFIIKLNSTGVYCWHSFYGHAGWNQGRSIATDDTDNLYLAGYSSSGWDGPNEEDPRNEHSGTLNSEITVIKAYTNPSPKTEFFSNPTSGPNPLDVQFIDQSTRNPLGWAWYFGDEDLSAVNWTEKTGSAAWSGRYGHSAVALPDGSIVLMGGKINGDRLNDVWRSTDRGQTWTLVNSNAAWPKRFNHAGIVLPDGSIILMGGDGETDKLNDVWRSTDQGLTWNRLSFDAGWSKRSHLSAVTISDGSIVIMGGDDGSYQNDVWRSLDRGATWTRLTDDAPWPGRYAHNSVVLPGDGIVLMGGEDNSGLTSDVWFSTDYGAGWADITGDAAWPARKWHASIVLPDGSILITGGWDGSAALNDLWRSVDGGFTWAEIHNSTDWEARALHAGVVLNDGSVVLFGGHDGAGPRNDVWSLKTAGSNEQNPLHIYHQPGTYQVTLQSYNAAGYSSISKPGYIEVRLPGSDAKLADLVISAGTLVPGFHADINDYIVDVTHDINAVDIIATLSDENATLKIGGDLAKCGEPATVILAAPGTATISDILVISEDGKTEKIYTITFNRLHFEPTFYDVPLTHPFYDEIEALVAAGITTGYDDGSFRPSATVTRMAMAAFLARGFALDQDYVVPAVASFTDVPTVHPFFEDIELLVAAGITEGYDDGTFRSSNTVTRMATAAFLVRGLDLGDQYEVPAEASFTDVSTGHPFYNEIELLAASGITGGYDDGTFRPSNSVTRMAMAAFLVRAFDLLAELKVNSVDPVTLTVDYGTEYEEIDLPEKVKAGLDDESEIDVNVDWAEESDPVYDPEETGEYDFEGELVNLPWGVTNPDAL